ncbi:hypothetical protein [Amycolatopsis alkalitolerans]|uniref:Uncharacterized protein n=1 Tax=Amycolatopsis alkalitolerans TaxID=2547244 RepID=A0A5C4MAX6_9PSEU|nr:hypothetical protein [Amycolatopsis alkalitolerans]TNC29050.1 hypothetical protein FG385_02785 [Amycolatopsis alkalitolerans]
MTVQETAGPETLDYRRVFGWPVHWHGGALTLETGSGIGAVAVPRAMAEPVLAGVARQGCAGPAVSVPTKHGAVVMLLVEADVLAPGSLPDGVRVLTAGTTIPLPGDRSPHALTHWIVPPDTHQRWLPSLTAVLASIRGCR